MSLAWSWSEMGRSGARYYGRKLYFYTKNSGFFSVSPSWTFEIMIILPHCCWVWLERSGATYGLLMEGVRKWKSLILRRETVFLHQNSGFFSFSPSWAFKIMIILPHCCWVCLERSGATYGLLIKGVRKRKSLLLRWRYVVICNWLLSNFYLFHIYKGYLHLFSSVFMLYIGILSDWEEKTDY